MYIILHARLFHFHVLLLSCFVPSILIGQNFQIQIASPWMMQENYSESDRF